MWESGQVWQGEPGIETQTCPLTHAWLEPSRKRIEFVPISLSARPGWTGPAVASALTFTITHCFPARGSWIGRNLIHIGWALGMVIWQGATSANSNHFRRVCVCIFSAGKRAHHHDDDANLLECEWHKGVAAYESISIAWVGTLCFIIQQPRHSDLQTIASIEGSRRNFYCPRCPQFSVFHFRTGVDVFHSDVSRWVGGSFLELCREICNFIIPINIYHVELACPPLASSPPLLAEVVRKYCVFVLIMRIQLLSLAVSQWAAARMKAQNQSIVMYSIKLSKTEILILKSY